VSAMLAEEPAAVVGGFAAAEGRMRLGWVVFACAAGPWLQAVVLYAVGRWRGRALRKSFGRLRRPITQALVLIRRRPTLSIFIVRFGFGMRIAMPLACGAARVRMPFYILGTLVVSLAWSLVFTLLGWAFGESAVLLLGRAERLEVWLVPALAVAVLVGWLVVRMRRRMREDEERLLRETREREALLVTDAPGSKPGD
jgi:membrane protein DedA with SNARE-associated domain